MSTSGSVESGGFVWTLRRIAAAEERGLLSVQGEQDLVSVTFERGLIVAADAMNHPSEEMLGEVLAHEGLLSPSDFHAAIERGRSGELASETLAAAGVIEEKKLLGAVRLQTYQQIVRVIRWRAGNFDWTADVESPYHRGVDPISVAELLLRASEELGSDGPLAGSIPELDTVFELNPDHTMEFRPLEQLSEDSLGVPSTLSEIAWLTRWERTLYRSIDGRQPASLLMLQSGFDPFQVKYALHTLSRYRLIRVRHQVSTENPLHAPLPAGVRSTDILGAIEPQSPTPGHRLDSPAALELAPARESGSSPALDDGVLGSIDLPSSAPRAVSPDRRERSVERPAGPRPASWEEDLGGLRGGIVSASLEQLLDSEPGVAQQIQTSSRRPPWGEVAAPWLARALAVSLLALLATTILVAGERDSPLLPFPWLVADRQLLDREQRIAAYEKVNQAVRTYQLLYGRYPEELGLLADLELLSAADLYDPEGRWLAYSPEATGYVLQPLEGGEPLDGLDSISSIENDFLLNPRYVDLETAAAGRAVVLLD